MATNRGDDGEAVGASPAAEMLGRRVLGADPKSGDLRVQYEARHRFTNRHGTLAGGFLAAMLDSLLALCAADELGPDARLVTSDLRVSFERPGKPGTLEGRARVDSRDDRSITCSGELVGESGTLIARGAATLRILSSEIR